MKFTSLVKKSIILTKVNLSSCSNLIAPNLYLYNLDLSELKQVKKILFYFDCNEYMHLGDHLFFLPLIQSFIDSSFDVEVITTDIMQSVFKALNLPVINTKDTDFSRYDLVISRIEMIDRVSLCKTLLVNVSKSLIMPICDQLLHDFGKFFNLVTLHRLDYTKLQDNSLIDKFGLSHDKKIILFNLYCDSSAYLINKSKINLLLNLIKGYATNPDYQLVLMGSITDRHKCELDFSYMDLRGKTEVLDIFKLVNCSNVFCYIGFDAFIMHVFSLLHKPSFVVFRGRITNKKHEMLKKYHINLFNDHQYVTLLN